MCDVLGRTCRSIGTWLAARMFWWSVRQQYERIIARPIREELICTPTLIILSKLIPRAAPQMYSYTPVYLQRHGCRTLVSTNTV